ncbi:unnamed protein product [Echinostoma caproni]|uniref:Ribonuclease E/G n=1 Tax=Echinostoma caproni TaxID=27848 RepID=A0A183ATW2_9TREM|nr:unnamed protein product [Echinostoma caproni]
MKHKTRPMIKLLINENKLDRVTIQLVRERVDGPDADDEAEAASARPNSRRAQGGARKQRDPEERAEDDDREARADRNEPDRDARRETRRQQRAQLDRDRGDVRRRPRYDLSITWRTQMTNK